MPMISGRCPDNKLRHGASTGSATEATKARTDVRASEKDRASEKKTDNKKN